MVRKPEVTPAEKLWWGLGAYILAADVYLWHSNSDTLSAQFADWLTTKSGKVLCTIVTTTIIVHLFYGIPLPFQKQAKIYLGGKRIPLKNVELLIIDPSLCE